MPSKPRERQSTISHDPYAFIQTSQPAQAEQGGPVVRQREEEPPAQRPAEAAKTVQTEKITTPFPVDLIERVRNAAYWERLTLTGIIVQAVNEAIERMEKERGEAYPPRKADLKGGRPIGSGKARKASNA
jgi:hypothetical protein